MSRAEITRISVPACAADLAVPLLAPGEFALRLDELEQV
jgi:hypothetical protein